MPGRGEERRQRSAVVDRYVGWRKCARARNEEVHAHLEIPDQRPDGSWELETYPVVLGGAWIWSNLLSIARKDKRFGLYWGQKQRDISWNGKNLWLASSKTWRTNVFPNSPLRQRIDGKNVSLPYEYYGKYVYGQHDDPNAIVTLKDGTTRKGPWRDGKPVGDWFKDHAVVPRPKHKPLTPNSVPQEPQQQAAALPSNDQPDINQQPTIAVTPPPTNPSTPIAVSPVAPSQEGQAVERPKKKQRQSKEDTVMAADDAEMERETSIAETLPDTAPSSTISSSAEEQEVERDQKTLELTRWLAEDVIGRSPIMAEMRAYARELIEKGFHSSEVVAEFCMEEDIVSWTWMLPIHKRIFRAWLQQSTT